MELENSMKILHIEYNGILQSYVPIKGKYLAHSLYTYVYEKWSIWKAFKPYVFEKAKLRRLQLQTAMSIYPFVRNAYYVSLMMRFSSSRQACLSSMIALGIYDPSFLSLSVWPERYWLNCPKVEAHEGSCWRSTDSWPLCPAHLAWRVSLWKMHCASAVPFLIWFP